MPEIYLLYKNIIIIIAREKQLNNEKQDHITSRTNIEMNEMWSRKKSIKDFLT